LARGVANTQDKSSSNPSKATTSAGMGSIGDEVQAYDSVIASQADGGAAINTEPLVLDFATMHDGHTTHQNPPLTPPHSQNASQDQDSWLTEDQDSSTAPAPPDFTGRGIHIPSRTS